MKKLLLLLLSVCVLFSCTETNDVTEVDVCIYGGTSAGVIAAYTAKMSGKTVLLIEPGTHLGGMSSGGLGYTDIGNKYVVTGLARDFYRRLGSHYGKLEQWVFEPKVAEAIFNGYIQRAGVEVWYNHRLHKVNKTDQSISDVVLEESQKPARSTNKKVKAKIYIDCSYEGDLMARAGVSYTIGREGNEVYGETYNGTQLLQGHQFTVDVDPYVIPGDPSSGLLWGVTTDMLAPQGTGDTKVQAYNFRIALTDDPANRIPITEPENYDPKKYELLVRLNEVSPKTKLNDIFIWSRMPNHKTDINNRGAFSTDMIGMNWEYPEADYAERARIWQEHVDYTKGLLYFVGHDERLLESLRNEMLQWGYPKDEYTDNGNWTHQLYIREARRMIGQTVMTQHHCIGEEVVIDPVGWAAYTMDSHNCTRLVVDGFVRNEGNVEIGGFPPYPISYGAIIPQKGEISNLIVPVCLSASHIAYGSIRMEPVFMVLAQSSAVAACLAIDGGKAVQDIDVSQLQHIVQTNPLADNNTAEILIDNDHPASVAVSGAWAPKHDSNRSYGADYLIDESNGKIAKSVKYTPAVVSAGKYRLYLYFPMLQNGSELTHVTIFDGKKKTEPPVKKSEVLVEGQTSGEWVDLGEFELPVGQDAYVEISNKGANGTIVADAVLFLPVK